jgi:diguanylate cyclase (GGDEF)-like protein
LVVTAFGALVSGACVTYGLLKHKPSPRWPWFMVVLALGVMGAGSVLDDASGPERSWVIDAITVPANLLLGLGLVGLTRDRSSRFNLDTALDALLVATLTYVLLWAFVVTPHAEVGLGEASVLALYPAIGTLVVSVVLYIVTRPQRLSASSAAFLVAVLAMLVGHVLRMLYVLDLGEVLRPVYQGAYVVAYFAGALSYVHPSLAGLVDAQRKPSNPSALRLSASVASLILPVAMVGAGVHVRSSAMVVTAACLVLLLGLALWRVLRTLGQHSRARDVLAHQATHDHLTGLPNRAAAVAFLDQVLSERVICRRPVSLLFVDLDRFKYVNDTHGHGAGDELIVKIARRFQDVVPASSLVARLGGDEFVVVLPDHDTSAAHRIGELVRACTDTPVVLEDATVTVGASVGVCSTEGVPLASLELTRRADAALRRVKESGRNAVMDYCDDMLNHASRRLEVEAALRRASYDDEFHLVYQPVVDVRTGRVDGAEALLRWTGPVLGDVAPDEFIPVAEETGLITALGSWVLAQACEQVAAWRKTSPWVRVSVNVSARQLQKGDFVQEVQAALHRNSLPGQALDIEITERIVVCAAETAPVLEALRALGVTISVDDFGTGYSSLSQLHDLPLDRIKVDRSFVAASGTERGAALVSAIVTMAHALGLDVVAEGVETQAQADYLHSLGAALAQGHFFAYPARATKKAPSSSASAHAVPS